MSGNVLQALTGIAIPAGLAFIMFAMGLALTPRDFARVLVAPRAVAAGLAAQLLLLPAVGFLVVALLQLPPALGVGLLILAACPGGITSNLLTHLARGDTALSITLTAVSSVAGLLTVPLIVGMALAWLAPPVAATEIHTGSITLGVLLLSGVPLVLGMTLRWRFPRRAARTEPKARRLAAMVFALIVFAAFASSWSAMMRHVAEAGLAVVLLNLVPMTLGWWMAALLHLGRPQRVAITLECGLQNAALGIFVAATLLRDETMMIPSMLYAVTMNVTALAILAACLSRRAQTGGVAG